MINSQEIDIDEKYVISDMKSVIFSGGFFYILANKLEGILGVYVLKIPEMICGTNDHDHNNEFLLKWTQKLDIADADMFIKSEILRNKNGKQKHKHLIMSFKNIYINTYSIYVINLNNSQIVYRHESFALWEAKIMSFFNSSTKDLIILAE